jgi:serine/threonine-protein kinase
VRRVKAALQQGLLDDPELTQDLTAAQAAESADSPWAPTGRDRADYEPTQLVPAPSGATQPSAADLPRTVPPTRIVSTPTSAYSPPTVFDAPPPAPIPHATPDRRAAHQARQARKRRRGWLAFLLVLLLTATAALAGWYLTTGRFTSAPALTTLSKAEAQQVAAKSGLDIHFDDDYSETIAQGMVISTDPGAGTKIRKGAVLEATVSLGPERYPMPTVVGLSQQAAETAVQQAHLAVGKIVNQYSETITTGIVISASKPAGASLKPKAAVDLIVSRGPKPIKITNYRGKSADQAKDALTKAGFVVVEKTANSDKIAKGLVIKQDPKSGRAMKGATITITRSLGPVMVTVPTVSRMGIRAAEKVMHDAGFKTKVRPVAVNYIGVGFVVYSSPRGSTQAPKGSTITLYVV